MTQPHPLDHPLWHSLTTRHAALAQGDGDAVRLRQDISILGAMRDHGEQARASVAALLAQGGQIGLVERTPPPAIPGTRVMLATVIDQMVLEAPLPPAEVRAAWETLGEADADDMMALADLTRPGPFLPGTHRLGRFVGVRCDGQLAAMAGERMKLPGWQEVSAICTHPDWRGHGLAGDLMCVVIGRMLAEGDGVFLHCFPDNPAARLYQAMGFSRRATMHYTILEAD